MNITDLLLDEKGRGMFMAKDPEGNLMLLCRSSFQFEEERNRLLESHSDILSWEVIEEHIEENNIPKE